MGRDSSSGGSKRCFRAVASARGRGEGASKRSPAAFEIHVTQVCEVVVPLPKQVRERWSDWGTGRGDDQRYSSLEGITARLEKARKKREEFQSWVMLKQARASPRRPNQEELSALRAKKLEEKLAAAEHNRLLSLEAVRLKAAAMHQRTEVVAERVHERQDVMAQKLLGTLQAAEARRLALQEAEKERLSAAHKVVCSKLVQIQQKVQRERESVKEGIVAKMVQADTLREARLAAAAAKAGSKVRHAKHVSKMRRLNQERCNEKKRMVLDSKLQTAADRRKEDFTVRSVVNAEKSETQFLKREAAKREKLRRQGCSRRVQQVWRLFRDSYCTTYELTRSFLSQGVAFLDNVEDSYHPIEKSVDGSLETPGIVGGPAGKVEPSWSDPFEEFASRLQSQATISAAKKLLCRLETRLTVKTGGTHECTALLRRLFPKTSKKGRLERYPTRVFLCAYMILNHPEVVFNRRGDRESHLSSAAKDMIVSFEKVLEKIVLSGNTSVPSYSSGNEDRGVESSQQSSSSHEWDLKAHGQTSETWDSNTVGGLIMDFDAHWVSYLEQFVAWKSHDAAGLESELIRMAVELEVSMLRKCHGDTKSPRVQHNSDLQAVVQQVAHDHELLRERIHRLMGEEGVHRLEVALLHTRDMIQRELASGTSETDESGSESSTSRSSRHNRTQDTVPGSNRSDPSQDIDPGKYGNEALVWELLYDPEWQFPSEEAEEEWTTLATSAGNKEAAHVAPEVSAREMGATLQKQVKAIGEKAFWDHVETKLASEAPTANAQLSSMLHEIKDDLMEVLPKQAAAEVREAFENSEVDPGSPESASQGGLETSGLLQMIQHTSNLLREYGAPARDEQADLCQQSIRTEIIKSFQESGASKRTNLAKAVTRALRLLFAQLKILRLDIANARLKILADSMPLPIAIKYVQDKFSLAFSLDSKVPELSLLKTRDWLLRVATNFHEMSSVLNGVLDGVARAPTSQIPTDIQSGLRASNPNTSRSQSARLADDAFLRTPIDMNSWKCCVRMGLVQIVSGESPALAENLPETLQLDARRLHRAQETFQKLLVIAAAMLILRQHNQNVGAQPMDDTEMMKIKERLLVVTSDPLMKLPSLTTELARIAGSPDQSTEEQMQAALLGLIASNRGSGGFKSLSDGLCKALIIPLVAGPMNKSPEVKVSMQRALTHIGAVPIADDVLILAKDLAQIAGVGEGVYGDWYTALCKHVSLI